MTDRDEPPSDPAPRPRAPSGLPGNRAIAVRAVLALVLLAVLFAIVWIQAT